MRTSRWRVRLGWLTIGLATTLTCLWAFWGVVENFHEGWFSRSLFQNLSIMTVHYLLVTWLFLAATLSGIRWPKAGLALFLCGAAFAMYFFRGAAPAVVYPFIVLPLGLLGVGFAVGTPEPRRIAFRIALGATLMTMIASAVEPVWRISTRVDDGNRGLRIVEGNGVTLAWAPSGPGWPDSGLTWEEAVRRCRILSEDGTRLEDTPVNIWRLPTADEIVRSQARHGRNAGGAWDSSRKRATYRVMPDKESPLWDPYSQIIYWWAVDGPDEKNAHFVVYNGQVHARPKTHYPGYQGFRCVRPPAEKGTGSAPPVPVPFSRVRML